MGKPCNVIDIASRRTLATRSNARRNKLVEDYLALVPPIARCIACILPPSFDVDDLTAAGYLGLIDAAERYRPGGTPFPAFARIRIRGSILDSVRRRKYADSIHIALENAAEVAGTIPGADEQIDSARLTARIACAITQLSPVHRAMIERHYASGEWCPIPPPGTPGRLSYQAAVDALRDLLDPPESPIAA